MGDGTEGNMGGACGTRARYEKCIHNFNLKNETEKFTRDINSPVNVKIILKLMAFISQEWGA